MSSFMDSRRPSLRGARFARTDHASGDDVRPIPYSKRLGLREADVEQPKSGSPRDNAATASAPSDYAHHQNVIHREPVREHRQSSW